MNNLKIKLVRDKKVYELVNTTVHVGMFVAASALSALAMAAMFQSLLKFPHP